MRRAWVFALGVVLLSCGPAVKQYKEDYVLKGERVSLKELVQDEGKRYFDPKTSTVRWLELKIQTDLYGYPVVLSREVTVGDWELKLSSKSITATHLPTGRTYKVKVDVPFPMVHLGVAKAVGNTLYIKEPLDGRVFVLDPAKTNKEVGVLSRAYLYDDGIAVVGGDRIRFCRNYDFRTCTTLYKLGKKGRFGTFFRSNSAFVFYVEDYRWNEKKGGYRWLRRWFVVSLNGKVLWRTKHVDKLEYNYPFWKQADKQYTYNRKDYYLNPYYSGSKSKPRIPYKRFAPPAVYEKDGRVYIFFHGQKAGSFKSITGAVMVQEGKVKFRKVKETNFLYTDYALGFCGDKVVVRFDGVWYNPEDNKKVKCSAKVVTLFSF